MVAAVHHKYDESRGLARPDVALCALAPLPGQIPSNVAVLFAYNVSPVGAIEARSGSSPSVDR